MGYYGLRYRNSCFLPLEISSRSRVSFIGGKLVLCLGLGGQKFLSLGACRKNLRLSLCILYYFQLSDFNVCTSRNEIKVNFSLNIVKLELQTQHWRQHEQWQTLEIYILLNSSQILEDIRSSIPST